MVIDKNNIRLIRYNKSFFINSGDGQGTAKT